jgi:hypothetical protein
MTTWKERIARGLTPEDYGLMCDTGTCMIGEAAAALGWTYLQPTLLSDATLQALEVRALGAVRERNAVAAEWALIEIEQRVRALKEAASC